MRKDSIDLKAGFITYVASKTGTRCELPLFDEFRKVCEDIIYNSDPAEPLLFPEAAAMHEHNHSGIVRRGKILFAKALFGDVKHHDKPTEIINGEPLPPKTPNEVLEILGRQGFKPQKETRIKDVYSRYVIKNQSYRQIEAETKTPKQTICGYMQEIEELIGTKVIRFEAGASTLREKLKRTRKSRGNTLQSVSVYGWGSLRATFCLLAIMHGVPEKEIINAVGHSDYRTTLKYYNNPTRAHQMESWKEMAATAIGHKTQPADAAQELHALIDAMPSDRQSALLKELYRAIPAA